MIIISGTTKLKLGTRDSVLANAVILMRASRAEPGCLAFHVSADIEDMRVIHHYEEWADEASLEAHRASDRVASFRSNIADHLDEISPTMRHDVSASAPLPD